MEHIVLPAFAGWAGPRNPRILIVGEAWGENEQQVRQPFVGASGLLLWEMLGEAMPEVMPNWHAEAKNFAYKFGNPWIRVRERWLENAGIAYTNVFNLRPLANRLETLCCDKRSAPPGWPAVSLGKYVRHEYLPEVERLLAEIEHSRPHIIVAAGNTAAWALLRATNIGSIRGTVALSTVCGTKVIPIYHPAAILRQWSWRPITVADLIKAGREAASPDLVRPERYVVINPDLYEIREWWQKVDPYELIACDIETHKGQIACIGFADSKSNALVVPFIDLAKPGHHYWPTYENELSAWSMVKTMLEGTNPKLFQNGLYDIQYILKMGIRPQNLTHDTMLLHHSAYPELRKGLGFLGSIYTNEAAWKLMGRPKADTVKRDE